MSEPSTTNGDQSGAPRPGVVDADATRVIGEPVISCDGVDKFFGDFHLRHGRGSGKC